MKKFLVVLLALAMILAIASTAMAADTKIPDYNDTKTSTEYANDIYRLTALGVLEGNTGWGGAYRPADNLTRAEFAKIACFMFGKQSQVNYYKAQPSAFSDVEEGFWAEGWINCANDNGLMIGIGGGKFAPQANVTKQEVATVVLRAVGYTDELPGAWPADYIAKSQKVIAPFASETLFDYVEIIDGTAATRAEMAAIVNYALDLYRVAPAGNQLIVNGISDADADGYLYKALKTNEADIYNFFLGVDIKDAKIEIPLGSRPNSPKVTLTVDPNLTTRETLLWDVFHAFELPYLFEHWAAGEEPGWNPQYVEASGWGYEDFDKGELVFADALTNARYSGDEPYVGQNDKVVPADTGLLIPVASDYYIFDDCLDGELWQLGGRLANLTVQIDVSKVKIAKVATGLAKGAEAVYAEMLSDVTYIDEETEIEDYAGEKVKVANADVFSLDLDGFIGANLNGNYDLYEYDWFKDDRIAIVKKVADDKVTVDNEWGEDDVTGKEGTTSVFCTLGDKCKKKHDQNYVFLKDGKLQDATCLKVNDVLYRAGMLAENEIELYIVYTPKAATLDSMSNDKAHLIMSGDKFNYCTKGYAHEVSYDGGYPDGKYEAINYKALKDQMQDDNNCLFAAGYGKKYVATIIFAAGESDIHFGVLNKIIADHEYDEPEDYFAIGAKIYGVDGLKDEDTNYDVSQEFNVGNSQNENIPSAKRYYGWLGNFELNDKGEIKIADKSLKDGVLTDPSKSGIGVPNGDDTGFVPLCPAAEPITAKTTAKGFFTPAAAEKIDALNKAINGVVTDYLPYNLDDEGNDAATVEDLKITDKTIIYEVKTKDGAFKSVKLGDPEKYIGHEFSADQISVFAWEGTEVKVLYVVNVHFNGDILFGLFEIDHVNPDGAFATFEDGTEVEINDDPSDPDDPESATEFDKLEDHNRVYALYKTKDNKADKVYIAPDTCPEKIAAGEFIVLIDADGFAIGTGISKTSAEAKALIVEYTDGAAENGVSDVVLIKDYKDEDVIIERLDDDCEFIDMIDDGFGFGEDDLHAGDDYAYIFVTNDDGDIIQVFRVNAPEDPDAPPATPGTDPEDNEEFDSIYDWLMSLLRFPI